MPQPYVGTASELNAPNPVGDGTGTGRPARTQAAAAKPAPHQPLSATSAANRSAPGSSAQTSPGQTNSAPDKSVLDNTVSAKSSPTKSERTKSGQAKSGQAKSRPSKKPHKRPFSSRRAAVIDLGTNNCRLLIAESSSKTSRGRRSADFRIIDSFSRIVRLGEGLSKSGVLNPDAMDRTVAALKICAQKIKRSGARDVRAVATQACRQAANGSDFLERVAAETGIYLKTINPLQEVQLGVASAMPLLQRRWPYALVFDVGGGSTEVSFLQFKPGQGFRLIDSLSVPLGVVSLAEDYGDPDQDLGADQFAMMQDQVERQFAPFAQTHDIRTMQQHHEIQTVGMSGTVTTVKALDLGLPSYDRRKVDRTLFDMAHLQNICEGLIAGGNAGLISNGCIGSDRADLVLPGIAILQALGNVFGFERLLVLDRGLREGLLHQIFSKKRRARRRGASGGPQNPSGNPSNISEPPSNPSGNPSNGSGRSSSESRRPSS